MIIIIAVERRLAANSYMLADWGPLGADFIGRLSL